jgi:short-subunit dehydrogenase
MALDFKGKTVLITGSSMGIGRGLSRCFAKDGANLALADLPSEEENLTRFAEELRSSHGIRTWTFFGDLADSSGPEHLHREVVEKAGDIYGLVNNAGICWWGSFVDMPCEERLEKMILLNCMAYAKLSRLFLPGMIEKNEGAILNVSSVAAFQPLASLGLYAATKAFTQSLSESIRYELPRGSRIVVSTLNPPFTKTNLIKNASFPDDFIPFSISFKDIDEVTSRGFEAFKRRKMCYVTGWQNIFFHLIAPRLLPRKVVNRISWLFCHRWSDFLPPKIILLLGNRLRGNGVNK